MPIRARSRQLAAAAVERQWRPRVLSHSAKKTACERNSAARKPLISLRGDESAQVAVAAAAAATAVAATAAAASRGDAACCARCLLFFRSRASISDFLFGAQLLTGRTAQTAPRACRALWPPTPVVIDRRAFASRADCLLCVRRLLANWRQNNTQRAASGEKSDGGAMKAATFSVQKNSPLTSERLA